MRRSLRIGVDIDGVLADQTREILQRINKQTGSRFRKRHVTAWNAELAGMDIEVEIERSLGQDSGYAQRMRLIPGAREALDELAKMHELVAITHRGEELRAITEEWIKSKKLPVKRVESTRGSSKSQVDVDVLIDDNPKNIYEFVCSSGVGILFLQPWNRAVTDQVPPEKASRIYRAANWDEVHSTIMKLEGQEAAREGV